MNPGDTGVSCEAQCHDEIIDDQMHKLGGGILINPSPAGPV